MNKQNIYHLSHTDLDGYSCQLVMSYTPHNMKSYNANYGAEVKSRLEEILDDIKANDKPAVILITDLNLTMDEAKWLDREVNHLNDKGREIKIILLDHHGSGQDSANKFEWYYLDTARCATKITYDYAKENFGLNDVEWMQKYVDIVNAVDLWKQEEVFNFEFGKVCMRLISETRELNRVTFGDDDRFYKLSLLQKAVEFIDKEKANIELDAAIHSMKKEFFMDEEDDTLDNLSTAYIVNLLGQKTDQMTIYYKGYKGFLSYSVGNTSIVGNGFLTKFDDYDFIVDVSYRGTMSFRANNKVSVSQIAKEWVDGGGHPNASGGRINGFKEQYRYDKVKEQIQRLIADRESVAGDLEYKKES
ncbi:phosphoesterase [Sulfurimonas sp. HSL3-2]|uniref:DHH family phosphoesterase n=1 Tax=Hydrocurvibacter mobilis TaxID=3131936 RepID=UPI0031F855FE